MYSHFTYFVTIAHNFRTLIFSGSEWSEEQRAHFHPGQGAFNTGELRKGEA